jgi:hypothetical protein
LALAVLCECVCLMDKTPGHKQYHPSALKLILSYHVVITFQHTTLPFIPLTMYFWVRGVYSGIHKTYGAHLIAMERGDETRLIIFMAPQ